MGTDTFRRHTRACVDAAIHRVCDSHPSRPGLEFFYRLVRVSRERSDLMAHAPTRRGEVRQVEALRNLLAFEPQVRRAPEDWGGARGHPLQVIDSLAQHLLGAYPVPRFLASVWFGGEEPDRLARRAAVVAYMRGTGLRALVLPVALTRTMAHALVRTPDHVPFDHALRRAEVLGLGGTPALAAEILATPLAERFDEPERWRIALGWLVRCGAAAALVHVRPVIDFLLAHITTIDLRGRTLASVLRLVADWHRRLARAPQALVRWAPTGWGGFRLAVEPTPREPWAVEWSIVELCDSHALAHEGRAMRHCVATYAAQCAGRRATIWSLRERAGDDDVARPVLTIQVRPDTRTIVQVRAKANARPTGWPYELVQRWAAREHLLIDPRAAN